MAMASAGRCAARRQVSTTDAARTHESATDPDSARISAALELAFPRAQPSTRRTLIGKARLRSMRADQTIFWQGDDTKVGILAEGLVAMQRVTVDGREITIRLLRPGNTLGLVTVVRNEAIVRALAMTDVRIVEVPASLTLALADADAGFAQDGMNQALTALVDVAGRIDELVYQDAELRVARVLRRHRDLWFSDPPVLLKRHLPQMIGTSREMVGRALRRLEGRGVLRRAGETLVLHNATLLDQSALGPATRQGRPRRSTSGRKDRGTSSSPAPGHRAQ